MHFQYSKFDPSRHKSVVNPFETLLDLFQQLLLISSGDVSQALRWLTELDKTYKLTESYEGYGLGDFIEDLHQKGYIKYDDDDNAMIITQKTERSIRNKSLEEVFKGLKRGNVGSHKTAHLGKGTEREPETRKWQFGDDINHIDNTTTLLNVLKHSSLENMNLGEDDLEVFESDHHTSVSTVLMIDLSHSMILYGEDRITPAKKVALALSELIMNNYVKDSLEIIAFGDSAWEVQVKDIPYLSVGPFHTNTLAGLELARHRLQRKKYCNKQIFMITDGKPSAMFEGNKLYKNSFGLDRKIVNKVLDEAVKCRREKITISTFMIATDPNLQNFVRELTEANKGRAYYASLNDLGGYIFEDYIKNRKKNVR